MLEWIAQNTVVAFGLALLAIAATVCLPKRPAVAHVCWVCVLVALIAPPLPRHGLLDGRSHAVRAAGRAAATVQALLPAEAARQPARPESREQERRSGVARFDTFSRQKPVSGAAPVGKARMSAHEDSDAHLAGAMYNTGAMLGTTEHPKQLKPAEFPAMVPWGGDAGPTGASGHGPARLHAAQPVRGSGGWLDQVDWRPALIAALVLVWLVGTALVTLRTVRVVARVSALVRRGSNATPAFRAFVERVAMDLDVRSPRVRVSEEVATPFVWGAARPVLVWPAGASEDSAGGRAVLAHELAHLERRDHWTAWLETVATCALWWHPLVYVARRELRRQAEKACDAWVVWAYPKDRRHYADALLDAVERLGVSPLPATALGAVDNDRRSLTRRLLMIMNDNVARRGSRALAFAAAGLTAIFAPTWAAASRPAVEAITGVTADIDRPLAALLQQARLEWEAGVYADGGDYENAIRSMNELLKARADDAGLHSRVAMMLYESGEFAAAAEHFGAAGELEREDADHMYNAACCLALAGDRDGAMDTLARAVALGYADADHAPENEDLDSLHGSSSFKELVARMGDLEQIWGAAERAMAKEAWSDAAQGFASAVTLAPECAELQHLLGYCLIMHGELDAAGEAFRAAMAMGFDEGICRYNLACVAAKSGKIEPAFEMLAGSVQAGFADHELLREDPDLDALRGDSRLQEIVRSVTAPMKLKRELEMAMEFGEHEAAAEKAAALLDLKPKSDWDRAWAYQQLAMAQFMMGDYRSAERAFGAAAESGRSLENSLYNIACCRSKRGDTEGALEYLRAAVEAGYSDAEHMRTDSDLAGVQGEPGFAQVAHMSADREILEQFAAPDWGYLEVRSRGQIERKPRDGLAHLQLGWALLRTGRTEEAMQTFERQAELGYMPGIASYNVACCHAILGNPTQAIAAIEKSIDYGFDDVAFMREDPDLANLHGDARFESLLAAHEHPHDEADHDHEDWDEDEDDDWDDEDDWDEDEDEDEDEVDDD